MTFNRLYVLVCPAAVCVDVYGISDQTCRAVLNVLAFVGQQAEMNLHQRVNLSRSNPDRSTRFNKRIHLQLFS